MQCTAHEIAEKKRLAQERLKKRKEGDENKPSFGGNKQPTSPGTLPNPTSSFYGNASSSKANELNALENQIKHSPNHAASNRILSQPYSKPNSMPNNKAAEVGKLANIFVTAVTCSCSMVSETRFEVKISGFHEQLVNVFKMIPSKSYGELSMSVELL